MSLGAVTVNNTYFQAPSVPTFVDDVSFLLDTSYPAGGYTGLALALQKALGTGVSANQQPRSIVDIITSIDLSGYVVAWDAANSTVRVFVTGTASTVALQEVATATNLGTVTLRLRVLSQ